MALPCGGEQDKGESLAHASADFRSAPPCPGKEEEWRRFVQEVVEERLPEYEQLRRRLGIRNESVWLARTKVGETVIVHLEVEAPASVAPESVISEGPFDEWLKERLLEFHGQALVHAPRRVAAKLIFAYPENSEDRPLTFREGS